MPIYKTRVTRKLRANSALNILRSFDYAKFIGRPLNIFVTIIFKERYDLISVNEIFREILNKTTRWNKARRRKMGLPKQNPVWIYCFENPQFNPHVHWCINLPIKQIDEFRAKLEFWLEKLQGQIDDNSIHISEINPYTDKVLAKYHVKGIDKKFVKLVHVQDIASYQGPIWGQRARVAREVGPTAIKRSGFKPSRDRNLWQKLHPWIGDGFTKSDNWDVKKVIPKRFGISFRNLCALAKQAATKYIPAVFGFFKNKKKPPNGIGLSPISS